MNRVSIFEYRKLGLYTSEQNNEIKFILIDDLLNSDDNNKNKQWYNIKNGILV